MRHVLVCIIILFLGILHVQAEPSKKELESIQKANRVVIHRYQKGNRMKAMELAKKVLPYAEGVLGKEHLDTLVSVENLAYLYDLQGRYALAEPLYKRVLEARTRVLGKEHLDTLVSVNNLAVMYQAQGRYDLAEALLKRVLKARTRILGKEHPKTLLSVNNLATLYSYQGRYALAEPLLKQAQETRTRVLGKEHPQTLISVNNLAGLYQAQGRYTLAAPLYKRALEVSERVLGKEHPDTIISVDNLAGLYQSQGLYALAEPLYKRALEANTRVLGKEHPQTLQSINNLALLYRAQGRYSLAEPLFKRALEASERVLGKAHRLTLTSLNNLALLYQAQDLYALAEPLFKRAVEVSERVLGKEHRLALIYLHNLAALHDTQGRYALAELLYKRALVTQMRVLGKEHPQTLSSVNALAGLYQKNQRRHALAEPLFKWALQERERILGREHPDTLQSVNSLAVFYHDWGKLALAEPLYKRVLEASERVLGKKHPNTLSSTSHLAVLFYELKDWTQATKLFDMGTSGQAHRAELSGGRDLTGQKKTEAQRESFVFQMYLKAAYRSLESKPKTKSLQGSKTFSRLQWIQGTGASAALSQMSVRVGAGNDRLAGLVRERQDLVQDWKGSDAQLSKALGLPPKKRNADLEKRLREQLQATEKRIGEIDATFSKDFPEYAELANPRPLSVAQVQAQLGNDEALVYIVDTPKWKKTEEETFIWVVTKTGMKWVRSSLGTKALTNMVKTLRCGLDHASWGKAQTAKLCNQLLNTNLKYEDLKSNNSLPFKKDIAYQLYDGLFGQVKEMIKGKKLLLVPSGPLTSLPFQVLLTEKPNALVDYGDLKWLVNEHDLTVLPSVASLKALRRTLKQSKASNPFLGIGNPLLTGPTGKDRSAWKKQSCDFNRKRTLQVAGWQLPSQITSFFRGGRVDLALLKRQYPLPETADELCAVADVLGAKAQSVNLGAHATERNVKKLSAEGVLQNAKVIHFATHGLLSGETQSLLKYKAEPSLMLTPPDTATQEDDGLLTASEIAQLKLDADWVILSACNTAAGDKPGAEPMSGLAKAFFYAGARALLVSHWAVDSNATVDLITTSLKAQTASPELGRAGALRVAMRKMIKSRRSHPAYWAPFVVVGEGSYISREW